MWQRRWRRRWWKRAKKSGSNRYRSHCTRAGCRLCPRRWRWLGFGPDLLAHRFAGVTARKVVKYHPIRAAHVDTGLLLPSRLPACRRYREVGRCRLALEFGEELGLVCVNVATLAAAMRPAPVPASRCCMLTLLPLARLEAGTGRRFRSASYHVGATAGGHMAGGRGHMAHGNSRPLLPSASTLRARAGAAAAITGIAGRHCTQAQGNQEGEGEGDTAVAWRSLTCHSWACRSVCWA